ncbi:3-hydroxyacyl-CoA dehydrogenase NAD-binding domain-containing protein [Sphingomonas oligophenolica]|uniref:3-hydroxyacyl-CoA dehydrogenase NAD-binding domain-containing protein n=1 Tax=Sphingomonas oligophenolica TaxID=301154 RepID=A0ABU9Y9W2_9SPHN
MNHWRVDVDNDGVALVTFDMAGKKVNTLSADTIAELTEIIERIRTDDAIKGVVVTSAKPGSFCAGGDLSHIKSFAGPGEPGKEAETLAGDIARMTKDMAVFRGLETCGKPVACAIEGTALGGGAEFAMACHYRVAADSEQVVLGLPEGGLGLLPGGGGTQRLPRLVGIRESLPILLQGVTKTAAEALAIGLIGEIAPVGQVIDRARKWVLETGDPVQPWDKPKFTVPGGGPYVQANAEAIAMHVAMSRQKFYGNYPAQAHILTALYEGIQVPFEIGLRIEMREFIKTVRTPQALAMIRTLFLSPREIKSGANRPAGHPVKTFKKASVLGAGLMGAGIACVQAQAGIETVLIDRTQEAADRGKAYTATYLGKQIARGRMTQDKADAILAHILATTDYANVRGSDIVIEAVFEDRDVKADVTRLAEAELAADAIMATNTSTLPITGLAQASVRPENFIGLHFFSPVERMDLVEIIRGEKTTDGALAAAYDYIAAIGKTPISVKDSRGFYTSRTITCYLEEPSEMLVEGIAPAIVENIGLMTGMPVGPLSLPDAIGLELPYHVLAQTKRDLGDAYKATASDTVLNFLVEKHGRHGRRNGKGFYDYSADGKVKTLWPGLAELAAPVITDASRDDVKDELKKRVLYRMSLEAAKCMEEGIITDPREADVGATMGFGFPKWTGGPISLIEQVGIAKFVAECDKLADRHGERFRPGQMLRTMAAEGKTFY